MKKSLLTAIGCLVAVVTLLAAPRSNEVQFKKLSFADAKARAAVEDKYLFIDIMATWCGPCKVMERNVFRDPSVAQYLNEHFVAIQIDVDETTDQQLLRDLDISAVPTLAFYRPDGQLALKEEGSMGSDSFLALAKKVKEWRATAKRVTNLSDADDKLRYLQMLSSDDPGGASTLANQYIQEKIQAAPHMDYATEEDWSIISQFLAFSHTPGEGALVLDELNRYLLENVTPILETNYTAAYDYYDDTFGELFFYIVTEGDSSLMPFYNKTNSAFQWMENEGTLPKVAFEEYNWLMYHYYNDNHTFFVSKSSSWLESYFDDDSYQHLRFVGLLLDDCADVDCVAAARKLHARALDIGLEDEDEREMADKFGAYLASFD